MIQRAGAKEPDMPLIEGRVWRLEVKTDPERRPLNPRRSWLMIVQADSFHGAVEQVMLALGTGTLIESCVRLDADGLIVPPAITQ